MTDKNTLKQPDLFPYPVSTDLREAPALTWVRNHSSYLTVGGFFNYLQVAGVYIRGILLNLLVFAPVILLSALFIGFFHHTLLNRPFAATSIGSFLFFFSIALFLFRGPNELLLSAGRGFDSLGRDVSVNRLNREGLVSIAVFALLIGIAVDLTPRVIEITRQNKDSLKLTWSNVSALIIGIATLVGTASRFLDRFESKKAMYVIAIVGIVSLSIPYLMLLGVANYLVYGILPTRAMYAWLIFLCLIAFAISLCVATRICLTKGMPQANKVFGLAATTCFAFLIGMLVIAARQTGSQAKDVAEFIGEITRPLKQWSSVRIPESVDLQKLSAFHDLVDKSNRLDSLSDVRFTVDGGVYSKSGSFSILWPGSWLSWLEDFDTDTEYFTAASDLLETGERLDGLDSTGKLLLLRLGADHSYQTVIKKESDKRSTADDQNLPSVNESLLTEVLRAQSTTTDEQRKDLEILDLEGIHKLISDPGAVQRDYNAAFQLKLPKRLSAQFLKRLGRKSKTDEDDGSTLDVAVSGPQLLDRIELPQFKQAWLKEMWSTRLSISTTIDLWADGIEDSLSGIAGLKSEVVRDVIQEARRRRIALSFTVRECLQLLDQKNVIHQRIPGYNTDGRKPFFPGRVALAIQSLSHFLAQPWSTTRSCEIADKVADFCSQLKLGAPDDMRGACFDVLLNQAIYNSAEEDHPSLVALAELFKPSSVFRYMPKGLDRLAAYRVQAGDQVDVRSLQRLAAIRYTNPKMSEPVLRRMVLGEFGNLRSLARMNERVFERAFWGKAFFVFIISLLLLILAWLYIDINRTSAHGFYRDRLSRAFLFDITQNGHVYPAGDMRLSELGLYSNGSVAPFHLVNCAVNLQRSTDLGIRDERSDFFTFNACFAGSDRTGYVPIEILEKVCPSLDVGTAMAISAGAASPNMGRNTNSLLVFLMAFANLRLGYWLPNPRKVVEDFQIHDQLKGGSLLDFNSAHALEIEKIKVRRKNLRESRRDPFETITDVEESLCGIACSGGGIRSAAVNLGVGQALHAAGLFPMFDYLSTVSGGGYFGSSVSVSMRHVSDQTGFSTSTFSSGRVVPSFEIGFDPWITGYRWITRPTHFLKEMTSWLSDDDKWINLSDGGHIENLGFYELLRRRCRFIVVGDSEADASLDFPSLTFAIQAARVRLNTSIQWLPRSTHLWSQSAALENSVRPHHALGLIKYPGDGRPAFVLYLKSSLNGDEPADIVGYARQHKSFPHESTADQFFDTSQFEAYRELGKHIAESALTDICQAGEYSSTNLIQFSALLTQLSSLFSQQSGRPD